MKNLKSKEEFTQFVNKFTQENEMPFLFGIYRVYRDSANQIIAVKYLTLNKDRNMGTASVLMDVLGVKLNEKTCSFHRLFPDKIEEALSYFSWIGTEEKGHENLKVLRDCTNENIEIGVIFYPREESLIKIIVDSIPDAHCRLALISNLDYKPNVQNLDGLFNVLPNLHWTDDVPYTREDYLSMKLSRPFIQLVDKIPLLTWAWHIPESVRVANTTVVRLGAHLAPGTTVMHYAFVNFNAGTLGKSMIEGRISAGTIIGEGSDVGAGAGFLGTLSGGNDIKLSVGKNCLVSANAECGVILGDNCVIAVGTSFSQTTPIWEVVEGKDSVLRKVDYFNGKNDLTFWTNSKTGLLEVLHRGYKAELNEDLHVN